MSDDKNNKHSGSSDSKSSADSASQELDWLEIEDEAFDESDFEHDYSETENGDRPEPVRADIKSRKSSSKKKSSSAITLMGLLLAGGGGYFYYANILNAPTALDEAPPVVSLSNDTQPDLALPTEADLSAPVDSTASATSKTQDSAIAADLTPQPSIQLPTDDSIVTQPQDGVLTPLPDPLATSQIDLVPLEGEQKISEVSPQQDQNILSESPDALSRKLTNTTDSTLSPTSENATQTNDFSFIPSDDLPSPSSESPVDLSEQDLITQTNKLPDSEIKTVETASVPLPETKAALPEKVETVAEIKSIPDKPASDTLSQPNPAIIKEKAVVSSSDALPPAPLTQKDAPAKTIQKQVQIVNEITPVPEKTVPSEPKNERQEIDPPSSSAVASTSGDVKEKLPLAQKKVEKRELRHISWKLRSAQPGMAVIYDPATGNMQSIETGDRVSGIGRVKSISQVNGKWLVRGTSGSISQ